MFGFVTSRILLALLLAAEVAHIGDDLLDAVDPLFCLPAAGRHQVEVFLAALEDDGEALLFDPGVSVFIEPLGLAAIAHRVNVINGDCSEGGRARSETLKVDLQVSGLKTFVCSQKEV